MMMGESGYFGFVFWKRLPCPPEVVLGEAALHVRYSVCAARVVVDGKCTRRMFATCTLPDHHLVRPPPFQTRLLYRLLL